MNVRENGWKDLQAEQAFSRRAAAHLVVAARGLDETAAARLRAARLRALAAHRPSAGAPARLAGWVRAWGLSRTALKQAAAVCAVLALAVAGDEWRTSELLAEYVDTDLALLAGELPVDVYLDQDFGAWLQQVSEP